MNRLVLFVVIALLGTYSAAWAEPPAPEARTGLEFSAMLGMNNCVPDGDDECGGDESKIEASWATMLSIGQRFTPNFGVYLDLNVGALSLNVPEGAIVEDVDAVTMSVMPTVRAFMPLAEMDVWVGLGAGYQSFSATATVMGTEFESSRTNTLDTKVELGAAFFLNEKMSVGLSAQMLYAVNGVGEACGPNPMDLDGAQLCDDIPDDAETGELFQLGAVFRMRL